MEKECLKCKNTFPATEEYFRLTSKKRVSGEPGSPYLASPCVSCIRKYAEGYRRKLGYKERMRGHSQSRYSRVKSILNKIKLDLGCVECGYREHPAALDFDHLEGHPKSFTIGQNVNHSDVEIIEEVCKCQVVCANCHRVRTSKRLEAKKLGVKLNVAGLPLVQNMAVLVAPYFQN